MSKFTAILSIFHQFFTSIALGNTYLCFSLMLVRKANTDEGNSWALWLYHQCNQSIMWMMA